MRGRWLRSGSLGTKVIAALYIKGEPATKEELAELSGVAPERVSSYLSGIPRVCRADKDRWAFSEMVEEPYGGIVEAIRQRIEQDGGFTSVEWLLRELPKKFGISKASVRTYLGTPGFVVGNGHVRLARSHEMNQEVDAPESVPGAVELLDGNWAFRLRVEQRYLEGYSAKIPAAIAVANGLAVGDNLLVELKGTKFALSIIWRSSDAAMRPDLGRLAQPLGRLGLEVGEVVYVAASRDRVELFRASELVYKAPRSDSGSTAGDDALADLLGLVE